MTPGSAWQRAGQLRQRGDREHRQDFRVLRQTRLHAQVRDPVTSRPGSNPTTYEFNTRENIYFLNSLCY
jgi:hypothetical protein